MKSLPNHTLKQHMLLVSLVALGALLRVYGLNLNSYWLDELISARISDPDNSLIYVYRRTFEVDVHPPLYYSLLWLWYRLFGYSELSGRLLSAMFGILLIPAMFALGKELFTRQVGLVVSFLTAVNFFFIKYSQETRSYEILVFITVCSFLSFTALLKKPTPVRLGLYVLSSTLLLNTHYFGLFSIAAQLLVWSHCLFRSGRDRQLLKYLVIAIITLILSGFHLVSQLINMTGLSQFWIVEPEPDFFVTYFQEYFGGNHLAIVMGCFLLFAMASIVYRTKDALTNNIVMSWIIVSYVFPFLRSVSSVPMLMDRYTIGTLPALLLLAAVGVCRVRGVFLKGLVLALISSLSLSVLFFDQESYSVPTKQEWRNVAQVVIERTDNVPVYASYDRLWNTYLKMLGSSERTVPFETLAGAVANGWLSDGFWVLDAYDERTRGVDFQGLYGVSEIERVEFSEALAVRFGYE